ncbi:MAG: protein translocase subunit SecD, partial [Gammaproteobacteria bacterium]
MNHYPLWKNLLIVSIVVIGIFYALPNLYGDDPAVQVSAGRQGTVDLALVSKVEAALKAESISYKRAELEDDRLMVRFADADTQLKAKEVLNNTIVGDYIIALNLAPTTPGWLAAFGAEPMNLGLDLRGGVHFLMEVDMDAAVKLSLNSYASELRTLLRDKKIRYKKIQVGTDNVTIGFRSVEHRDSAESIIGSQYNQLEIEAVEDGAIPSVTVKLTEVALRETRALALQQNIVTLRNRINELGVAEPTVQQQGEGRIVVQLPGVQDTAQAKKILGATATLEFRLVD